MADGYTDLTKEKLQTNEGVAELNRMIRFIFEHLPTDGSMVKIYQGYGSPEGLVVAGIGSVYMRFDGGANTTLYAKEADTNEATGWSAL